MNAWSLADLDIIAYASALEEPVRPRVLPPVYRVRDTPEVILSTPFTLADGQVINPVVLCQQEFEDFVLKEKITPLPQPLAAKARWDLWVNDKGDVAYQPKSEVTQAFEALFTTHLGLARRKLAEKDLAAASRHAEVARSAKPSHLDPLIILGAVELLRAEPGGTGFNFYQHLATRYIEPAEFERLAREQAGQCPSVTTAPVPSTIQAPATEGDIEHVRNSLHVSQAEADAAKAAYNNAASQVVVLRTEVSALKALIDKQHAAAGTVPSHEEHRIATSPSAQPTVAAASEPPAPAVAEPVDPAPESEASGGAMAMKGIAMKKSTTSANSSELALAA